MNSITLLQQVTLPLDLFHRFQQIRERYAAALRAAASGDFSRSFHLRAASRLVGRLLAQEAHKSPEERGGMRMLDLFLATDRLFPELRGWNEQHIREVHAQRISSQISHPAAS